MRGSSSWCALGFSVIVGVVVKAQRHGAMVGLEFEMMGVTARGQDGYTCKVVWQLLSVRSVSFVDFRYRTLDMNQASWSCLFVTRS